MMRHTMVNETQSYFSNNCFLSFLQSPPPHDRGSSMNGDIADCENSWRNSQKSFAATHMLLFQSVS